MPYCLVLSTGFEVCLSVELAFGERTLKKRTTETERVWKKRERRERGGQKQDKQRDGERES